VGAAKAVANCRGFPLEYCRGWLGNSLLPFLYHYHIKVTLFRCGGEKFLEKQQFGKNFHFFTIFSLQNKAKRGVNTLYIGRRRKSLFEIAIGEKDEAIMGVYGDGGGVRVLRKSAGR
jgi:hypothetical protein